MAIESKTTMDPIHTANVQAYNHQILNDALNVGRFTLHFLEMLVAMMAGMPIFFMLGKLVPASSSYSAVFKFGTIPFEIAMAVVMTVPMVAWMIVRGHGWRHSAEMGFGMVVPVAAIVVLRLLGADASLPWLAKVSHPAMFLGMLAAMLYRRSHFTGKAGHSAHAAR